MQTEVFLAGLQAPSQGPTRTTEHLLLSSISVTSLPGESHPEPTGWLLLWPFKGLSPSRVPRTPSDGPWKTSVCS